MYKIGHKYNLNDSSDCYIDSCESQYDSEICLDVTGIYKSLNHLDNKINRSCKNDNLDVLNAKVEKLEKELCHYKKINYDVLYKKIEELEKYRKCTYDELQNKIINLEQDKKCECDIKIKDFNNHLQILSKNNANNINILKHELLESFDSHIYQENNNCVANDINNGKMDITIKSNCCGIELQYDYIFTKNTYFVWGSNTKKININKNNTTLHIKDFSFDLLTYKISGNIHIYNVDTKKIHVGVICSDDNEIYANFSNYPVLPLCFEFDAVINIQMYISKNK